MKSPFKSASDEDGSSPLEREGGSALRAETDEPGPAQSGSAGADLRQEAPRRHRGFAKQMRKNPSDAERSMWAILKDGRLAQFKFRRQVPIGPHVADFVCYASRLIIELDTGQQGENAGDLTRDEWLAAKGFSVLRVRISELTQNRDGVLDTVLHKLEERRHG